MHPWTLIRRGLWFYRRTNFGVAAGVAVGAAVLTGALLVGDSMRNSLRDAVLNRLGRVELALQAPQFFAADLAGRVASAWPEVSGKRPVIVPAIYLEAGVDHAQIGARARGVGLYGVDKQFWRLDEQDNQLNVDMPVGRSVVINDRLAQELNANVEDFVLVRTAKPSDVALETLLGRRDEASVSLRLRITAIIPSQGLGGFSLFAQQAASANAFVPIDTLQERLDATGEVNLLLFPVQSDADGAPNAIRSVRLQQTVQESFTLTDVGLSVRLEAQHGYIALDSDSMLLTPAMEDGGVAAANSLRVQPHRVLTYLANEIALTNSGGEDEAAVPYSTIAAIEPTLLSRLTAGMDDLTLTENGIVLNDWTARDLGATIGDPISVQYFLADEGGLLNTQEASFVLRGVVPLDGPAGDRGFTPTFEGITDVRSMADWNPPFPINMNRIRDKDEQYWDDHRATPKAFVHLARGQQLWAREGERFGRTTSLRMYPPTGVDLDSFATSYTEALKKQLDVARFGLRVQPVRQRALEASGGSTDFGGLFIGFSFFLIASAAMLVALLFRLSAERRAAELGLLLATGLGRGFVVRLLLVEALAIAVAASLAGMVAAGGYAWLMIAGLRTWWSEAVNAPFLRLYASVTSYGIGFFASILVAVASMAWSLRGLARIAPSRLLAGQVGRTGPTGTKRPWVSLIVVIVGGATSGGLLVSFAAAGKPSQVLTFFGSGAATLCALLGVCTLLMRRRAVAKSDTRAAMSPWSLSLSNIPRHTSRSMLTIALIASATFIIASLQSFTIDVADVSDSSNRHSGSGGFALFAESAVPLPYDLNTPQGRAKLNIPAALEQKFADTTVMPFRLRNGQEISCLNLYLPKKPKIIGAPDAMIQRGGFAFSTTSAATEKEHENPWRLLTKSFDDGAVPVIGDQAAVLWQVHSNLGKDIQITDQQGNEVTLRFVALLTGSVLQNELVISESQFERLFPSTDGHSFFLIDCPTDKSRDIRTGLEKELAQFAMDVGSTAQRITDFNAVQNTYIATFQTLGGLGLVLGTAGLGAVLARNVWERRSELALLQAVGIRRATIGRIVLWEHLALAAGGLLVGAVSAGIAIAPHLAEQGNAAMLLRLLPPLAAAFVVGVFSAALALRPTLRAPLIPALRKE